MATILVVDDEPGIRLALRYVLEQNDFEVIEAIDGGDGIDQFRKNKPDVVVLDILMKPMDGYDACERIRRESDVPIIFLSSKDDVTDQKRGYNLGQRNVDYVIKDANVTYLEIVVAKIGALLNKDSESLLQYREICMALDTYKVLWEDEEVHLTATQFNILKKMLREPQKVHSRNALKEHTVSDAAIDSHVRDIRNAFKTKNGGIDPILTAGGRRGFRLYDD